jgi:protoporphyrin/coproporphyrin ferrochelatase
MSGYAQEPPQRHGDIAKTGILLINLGTPDAPTAKALRPYLKEFLSDPRVIEIPRLLWWPILNLIILNLRPKQSAKKYAAIWTEQGSPLRIHTETLAKLLRGYLGQIIKTPLVVDYAMRYGAPSIATTITNMKNLGCDKILAVPLYPQYAASSTASAFDALFAALKAIRNTPAIRTVKHYHDHPKYIDALAQNVRDYWMKNGRPDKLLMSFHGVPRFSLDKGDPYHCECHKTARLLAQAIPLKPEDYLVTFQSRFGKTEWLQPYTAVTLEQLGKKGVARVDVICPGFVCDCLETLEEIAIEGKVSFLKSGGKEFHFIPCLNKRPDWVAALSQIVLDNLGSWVSKDYDAATAQAAANASRDRARALGAKN